MNSLVKRLKHAIVRQEKKQKDVADKVFVNKCHLCRVLNGRAPLQPEVAAGLMKELNLENLAIVYCSGCPVDGLRDRRQYQVRAA